MPAASQYTQPPPGATTTAGLDAHGRTIYPSSLHNAPVTNNAPINNNVPFNHNAPHSHNAPHQLTAVQPHNVLQQYPSVGGGDGHTNSAPPPLHYQPGYSTVYPTTDPVTGAPPVQGYPYRMAPEHASRARPNANGNDMNGSYYPGKWTAWQQERQQPHDYSADYNGWTEPEYRSRSAPYLDHSYESRYTDSSIEPVPPPLHDQYRREYVAPTPRGAYGGEVKGRRRHYTDDVYNDNDEFGNYDGDYCGNEYDPDYPRDALRSRDKSRAGAAHRQASAEQYGRLRNYYIPSRSRSTERNGWDANGAEYVSPSRRYTSEDGGRTRPRYGREYIPYEEHNGYEQPMAAAGAAAANGFTATPGNVSFQTAPANMSYAPAPAYDAGAAGTQLAGAQLAGASGAQLAGAQLAGAQMAGAQMAGAASGTGVGYQVQSRPCQMCGGSGYHTHGEYIYQPPGAAGASAGADNSDYVAHQGVAPAG